MKLARRQPWLIEKYLASGLAVSEKGGIQTDQDIPISSDLGSSDLNKAIGRHLVFCLTKSATARFVRPQYRQLGPGGLVYISTRAFSYHPQTSLQLSTSGYQSSGQADLELGILAHPISLYGVNGQISSAPAEVTVEALLARRSRDDQADESF
ncbi:hypothetical protein Taro_015096 [Colocasia esculenta]|uniref:Uncharacterized protein n=1 Tax=Colocasia esculenta TaxID=4460 RepID=A0A843UGH3_COLES|nr:hypothetical protein [Colocasia esculenta]